MWKNCGSHKWKFPNGCNGSSLTFVKPIWNPVENDAVLAAAGDPHEALGPLNVCHVVNVVSVNDDEGVSAAGDPLGELEAVSLLRGVDLWRRQRENHVGAESEEGANQCSSYFTGARVVSRIARRKLAIGLAFFWLVPCKTVWPAIAGPKVLSNKNAQYHHLHKPKSLHCTTFTNHIARYLPWQSG